AARGVMRSDDVALVPDHQVRLLRGVAMFAPLPMSAIEELADNLVAVTFGPGEVLWRVGDVGDRFLIIDRGTVEVEAEGTAIRTIGPGGYCGEIALLRDIPRTATVRSITEGAAF